MGRHQGGRKGPIGGTREAPESKVEADLPALVLRGLLSGYPPCNMTHMDVESPACVEENGLSRGPGRPLPCLYTGYRL